jgi:phosphoglycerate dehydrogenase-like enzyme
VVVTSGMWRNELLGRATRLRFVQSISAGTDQYDKADFAAKGIRLASAQGANEKAVAEHALALMLAISRHLVDAVDNQRKRYWRPMIASPDAREAELGGQTLLIIGLGRIGQRAAALAKAFGMTVTGVRRNPEAGGGAADSVHAFGYLPNLLPKADFVLLTCPLTPETENMIGAAALAAMKPTAYLVNMARGRCVDQDALIAALDSGGIAGAALDTVPEEPLPESSPLWDARNIFITPHAGGETQHYENRIIDLLMENLGRLERGDGELKNQIV